ncbi:MULTISPECIES: hypothetical protein [Lactobacillales]|uniref:hypothetical protein n=1 Tax=Lactobacillales TaxID=186826 RepID=UPI00053C045E|nr:hypothetical protein [Enterococcus faecalis]KII46945.1 hypothetical protein QZ81_05760 [Enterococcus faecalis]HBI2089398.1 hypothetical protein [Enterococcus faecalis]
MSNILDVQASELPVLQAKDSYKYLDEISGNGAYHQVAWQQVDDTSYIALYGTEPIELLTVKDLATEFPDEMEE